MQGQKSKIDSRSQSSSTSLSKSSCTKSCCKRLDGLCGMHWTLGKAQTFDGLLRIKCFAGCAQQQFLNTFENYMKACLSDLPDASSLHFVWNIQPIQQWVHMHPFPKLS